MSLPRLYSHVINRVAGPTDDYGLLGRHLGAYEIEAVIGRGAFATVYRARHRELGREAAVKVLDPVVAHDPHAARRFSDEARRAAVLDHPGIVPVYDAGEDQGFAYLAMRLISGPTLSDEIERDGHLSPQRLLDVVTSLAAALDHAHDRGIVHRDVKPDNVLLESGRVYLADFGIAATVQSAGRYTTGAIGTAQYMAPEQARVGPIDGRADLYALGCVTYECFTGTPPYAGTDFAALLVAHAQDPAPGSGWLPMDTFVVRALAKHPDDRFRSGAELVAALQQALAGERLASPQPASRRDPDPPPPPLPGRRRWWRR
jgi:eukaryotic-like serine/threonine-protein kinase